jgi:dihydroorotase
MSDTTPILIKNALVINESKILPLDILIKGERIEKIDSYIQNPAKCIEINAEGMYLMPGVIDDQVHFREPGLTHKAEIYTESRAALFGGVTSYMEMPNVIPQTTDFEKLEEKYQIASKNSAVNYSFYLGGTNHNLDVLKSVNTETVCGVKIFMGSSTGNMLVDDAPILEAIFRDVPTLIATHCECETRVKERLEVAKMKFPKGIPADNHPVIRDATACYLSSSLAVELARKYHSRLHILHITSEIETHLFSNDIPLNQKRITSEVCVHHLHFTDQDYHNYQNQIKCNPAIKSQQDQDALWKALLDDRLDVIATDHAPHTVAEKFDENYLNCHAGLPLVQHPLLLMLEKTKAGNISIEKLVEKMSHNVAIAYKLKDRGFIREGYFADLVLVNPNKSTKVDTSSLQYKCGWSPLEGIQFSHQIEKVWVNGALSLDNGCIQDLNPKRLLFEKDR